MIDPLYAFCLVVTVALEVLAALLVPRSWRILSRGSFLMAVVAVNGCSHPLAAWALTSGWPFGIVELGVLVAETVAFRWAAVPRWSDAVVIAAFLNAVTVGAALFLLR